MNAGWSGVDRILLRFYIGIFSISVGFGIMTPAVPLLATLKFSANDWELGTLGTLVALPYVVAPFLFGRMSDRVGRRPLILFGIFVYLITSSLYITSSGLLQIALLRILEGLAFSMIWPSTEAFVGDVTNGSSRNRAVGLYSVAWSSGYMIGSFLMGGIVSFVDITFVFMVTSLTMVIGIGSFFPMRVQSSNSEDLPAKNPPRSLLLAVFYIMLVWGFSVLSFFFLFPSYATKNGINPSLIGYLVGTAGLVRTLVFLFYSRIIAFTGKNTIPLGMLSLSASMLISWIEPSPLGFAISVSLLGLSLGLLYAHSLVYMLSLPSKGLHAGILESSIGLGELIGPIIMGSLAFVVSPSFPYLCLSLLGGASTVVTFLFITCGQKKISEVS